MYSNVMAPERFDGGMSPMVFALNVEGLER